MAAVLQADDFDYALDDCPHHGAVSFTDAGECPACVAAEEAAEEAAAARRATGGMPPGLRHDIETAITAAVARLEARAAELAVFGDPAAYQKVANETPDQLTRRLAYRHARRRWGRAIGRVRFLHSVLAADKAPSHEEHYRLAFILPFPTRTSWTADSARIARRFPDLFTVSPEQIEREFAEQQAEQEQVRTAWRERQVRLEQERSDKVTRQIAKLMQPAKSTKKPKLTIVPSKPRMRFVDGAWIEIKDHERETDHRPRSATASASRRQTTARPASRPGGIAAGQPGDDLLHRLRRQLDAVGVRPSA